MLLVLMCSSAYSSKLGECEIKPRRCPVQCQKEAHLTRRNRTWQELRRAPECAVIRDGPSFWSWYL